MIVVCVTLTDVTVIALCRWLWH